MSQIWMSTSVYLWQYLARTSSRGFFLSLSDGLDSSTIALFVYGMAKLVLNSIEAGLKTTLAGLRRITGMETLVPKTPEEIVGLLLTTCYTSTVNSSKETSSRAQRLAEKIGARHLSVSIDQAVEASIAIINEALQFTQKYTVEGGTRSENLALQNIQARSRMTEYAIHATSACHHDFPVPPELTLLSWFSLVAMWMRTCGDTTQNTTRLPETWPPRA